MQWWLDAMMTKCNDDLMQRWHDAMIIYAMVTGFNHDLMKWWLDEMMTWCNDDLMQSWLNAIITKCNDY